MIQRTGDGPVDCPTTVAGGHGREDQGGGVAGRTAWPRGPLKLHYSEGVAFIRAETHGSGSRDRRACGRPFGLRLHGGPPTGLLKCGLSALAVLAATAPQAECLFETEHGRVTDLRALTGGTARSLQAAPTTRLSRANSTCRPGRWPPVTGPSPFTEVLMLGLWDAGAWNQRPEPCDGVLMDSEMTERNRRIVEQFIIEGVLEGLDVFDELCDPGVINHAAARQAREGIDALKRVIRFSRAAMPDQRWTDRVLVADEEYVVIRAARESTWSAGSFLASPRRRMSPRQLRWCIVGGWPTGRSSSTGPSEMTWPR